MFVGRSRQMLEKFWKSATVGNAMDLFGFYKIKFQRHAKALHLWGWLRWVSQLLWRQVHFMVRLDPLSEFSACGVYPITISAFPVKIAIHRSIVITK